MIGQMLGRYRLVEQIGAGGMGVVYRAHDDRLERDVAIKVLPPGALADDAARRRFHKEALALSKLSHPNVASVHDFDTADGVDFLVMELVSGTSVDARAAAGALPEREVLALGIQLADGLAAAHAEGVIHRDLKPGNLRLTADGRLKILDFGLAQLLRRPDDRTQTGTVDDHGRLAGTLAYMAPEQVRGEAVDARTDLYAAGAVLYELATGRRPFADHPPLRVPEAIVHETPPAPRAVNARVSVELDRIVTKCLDKNPERRYQTAVDLRVDLERLRTPSVVSIAATRAAPARRRAALVGMTLVALAAAAALGTLLNVAGLRDRLRGPAGPLQIQSIAVLPLENLSRDSEQEYFADGMTEALIADLAKISALRVISRTSVMRYKSPDRSLPEIARALNVDAVMEGSVLRAGDRVRITAQLFHAPTDRHLWAETYERDLRDVLALQSEVARAIAAEIHATITPDERRRLTTARPIDPAAHRAYLEGRYQWNKRTPEGLTKAVEHFRRAIDLDPAYALAYSGVAESYVLMPAVGIATMAPRDAVPKAKAAATKALEIDDTVVDAYTALGYIKMHFDWDWIGAEQAFLKARELNPNLSTFWYGAYLADTGRHSEAIREAQRAQTADPLSPIVSAGLAWMYHLARQHDRAIEASRTTLELAPDFPIAYMRLGWAYQQKAMYPEALAAFEKAITLSGRGSDNLAALAYVHARAGQRRQAERVLATMKQMSRETYVSAYNMALVYTGLGDKESAFEWLEEALSERAWAMAEVNVEPALDPLRSDPRFGDIVRRVGLR